MPSLTQVRDAAIAHLKTALPAISRIEGFAGELDMTSAAGKNLPKGGALFVSVGEAVNSGADADMELVAAFGVFAVARTSGKREAGEAEALALAEAAVTALHGQAFDTQGVGPALVRGITPVPDESLEKLGVSIWSVIWEQLITFDTATRP